MIRVARLAQDALPLVAVAILSAAVAGAGTAEPSGAVPKPAPAAETPHFGAAAPTPKPMPPKPSNLEPLAARDDTGILGKKIMGPDGKELGLLVDVLVDARGRPQAAVIDFGGFLGVGSRKIAVDWRLLKLSPAQPDWKISLNLGREEIRAAPEYKPGEAADMMVGPPKAAPSPDGDK